MQTPDALKILEALIRGEHPDTGAALSSESVLQHPNVLRALLIGCAAMVATAARASRRAKLPPHVGKVWGTREETALKGEFESGMKIEQMAGIHGRTVRAIEARLVGLKLIERSEGDLPLRLRRRETSNSTGASS